MEIRIDNDAATVAARHVVSRVRRRPALVLGLASGRTMIPLYTALATAYRRGEVSFAQVRGFLLDDYLDLPPDSGDGFRAFVERYWRSRVDALPAQVSGPDTVLARECPLEDYTAAIRAAGGIDLQLLGIGRNGHIGFNEPPSAADSRLRVVKLSDSTRKANRRYSERPPPRRAITLGVADILEAREILLLATGAEKAEALAAAVEGPMTPDVPASALRQHERCLIVADPAAAARLHGS
ncbi:MAG TPA: glucosamine-6-phosphate deaminase [Gammaproteobacteria bacterium]|nr:glucosamine-6-phosphate deaminase [Gammaproteobacteria bacterium]